MNSEKTAKNEQKWARYGLRKRVRVADLFLMDRYGIMFGIVTGMMVYIVLAHLLPAAHRYDPNDTVCTPCVTVGMVRRADRGPHTLRAGLRSLVCSQVVMAASLMMFMA